MNRNHNYLRVVTEEREESADVYLYGYIGQDSWWNDEMKENNLTDLEVVRVIKDLEKKHSRINIRINSPGGSVFHGDPIITAMRNSTSDIHTYIDGIAGSMAADIWAAGNIRHMASNSKLMIHSTSSMCWGTAKDMIESARMLEVFDNAAISTFSNVTGMSEQEVRERFYDYRDHWLTASEAKEIGLINEIETYEAYSVLSNPEKMSYIEVLRNTAIIDELRAKPQPEEDAAIEIETFILTN